MDPAKKITRNVARTLTVGSPLRFARFVRQSPRAVVTSKGQTNFGWIGSHIAGFIALVCRVLRVHTSEADDSIIVGCKSTREEKAVL